MRNDLSVKKILEKLSEIPDVIFVGGTSEFLQGLKPELRDIDISVSETKPLEYFGYVFQGFNDSLYGLSGNRAFIPLQNIMIDVFVDHKRPESILVNGFKCETVSSMISLRENTLKYYSDKLSNNAADKIRDNLERLKVYSFYFS